MFKNYIISKLKDVSAWVGFAVILSVIFLPHSVTIGLGIFLIITPDSKLRSMVEEWEPAVKDRLNGEKHDS